MSVMTPEQIADRSRALAESLLDRISRETDVQVVSIAMATIVASMIVAGGKPVEAREQFATLVDALVAELVEGT